MIRQKILRKSNVLCRTHASEKGATGRSGKLKDILIWDSDEPYPESDKAIVLWRSFLPSTPSDLVSIPLLIEENADAYRAQYLSWIYELGETLIGGRRLVDHLEVRQGFSYWWMTLLAEKCNFSKSTQINDAVRLLAFTDWATKNDFGVVALASANHSLADCFGSWCEKSGIVFEWQRLPERPRSLSWFRQIFAAMPLAVQAWVWLANYILERWSLRGVGLQKWRRNAGRLTFFSYLFNLAPESAKAGRFESRYWAHLPDVLSRESCQTNWLHLYVKSDLLPTASTAAHVLNSFNKSGQNLQCHVTLDTFLGPRPVIRTLRDWLRMAWIGVQLEGELAHAQEKNMLNLWPLFRGDWYKSMVGSTCMENLLYLNLFDVALTGMPKQQQGVYLMENQGWEFGLIGMWKAAGHGCLIGVPHSTVRFWDLRYFFDPSSYLCTNHNGLPVPNIVACNGPVMRDAFERGGSPVKKLTDVEALRYLHLLHPPAKSNVMQRGGNEPPNLLVLGDYLLSNTRLQMSLLEQAVEILPIGIEITVKPHPNCPIRVEDYPSLRIRLSMEPIAILLAQCDVAYTSAVTSAAVDAYCAGVPVVSVLTADALNLSPLRDCAGPSFISTYRELAGALSLAVKGERDHGSRKVYFLLDAQLPKWKQILFSDLH